MNRFFNILSNNILTCIFLIVLSFSTCLYGQELSKKELFELSLDSLLEIENSLDDSLPYYRTVLDTRIKKVKYLNDTIQLLDGYRDYSLIEEYDLQGQIYIDSMIGLAAKLKNKKYLAEAYFFKGAILYLLYRPQEAIDEVIKSYEFAKIANDHYRIVNALNLIAGIKSEHGELDEAILLHKQALIYLNENKDQIEDYEIVNLLTHDNISKSLTQAKQLDSARYYANEGLELAIKNKDQDIYYALNRVLAQINYYDNNLVKARDTLSKYIKFNSGASKADSFYYLGMIEGKLGTIDNKRMYFKKVDSILVLENLPIIDNVKEVYQFLLKDAHEQKDTLEKAYMHKLFYYDSIIEKANDKIKSVTLTKFDLPLEKQKELLAKEQIENKNRTLNFLYVLTTIVFIILSYLTYRYIKIKILLKRLLNEDIKPIVASNNSIDPGNINIDKEVIENTLKKIDEWENKNGFLDKEIDQNSLAKELDTNSTYLSRIINAYKKQSFSNYIKDLRVTYAINYIKRNPSVVQTKSMIQLAESFGFNSIDVFNRAFKLKVGFTPSVFFKQIKKVK